MKKWIQTHILALITMVIALSSFFLQELLAIGIALTSFVTSIIAAIMTRRNPKTRVEEVAMTLSIIATLSSISFYFMCYSND